MAFETHAFDVVVAGCGIGGLSAAVSALEEGASVAILERAPEHERGGNTRYTEAYLRMKSETEVTDDFEAHFMQNSGGYLDPREEVLAELRAFVVAERGTPRIAA